MLKREDFRRLQEQRRQHLLVEEKRQRTNPSRRSSTELIAVNAEYRHTTSRIKAKAEKRLMAARFDISARDTTIERLEAAHGSAEARAAELASMKEQKEQLESYAAEREARLAEREANASVLYLTSPEATEKLEHERTAHSRTSAQLAELGAEADGLRAEVSERRLEIDDCHGLLAALRQQLAERDSECAKLREVIQLTDDPKAGAQVAITNMLHISYG